MKKELLFALLFFVTFFSFAQTGEWTWMKGSNVSFSGAVYGTQGIPAPTNTPQGMYEACEWRDKQGNFWLYGGDNSNYDNLSNLWEYQPSINQWTWIKGPGAIYNQSPVYGTQGVPSINNTPGARAWAVATWVDTSGNFWLLGGRDAYGSDFGDLWKYEVATNEWAWMKGLSSLNFQGVYGSLGVPSAANRPGARSETNATWTDKNNNLWLFGGSGYDHSGVHGLLNDVWKYDIASNEWTWIRGSMNADDPGSYGTKGVADTSNNPHARMIFTKWNDAQGNFWVFAGGDWNSENYFNDVWKYDPVANNWTWESGPNLMNNNGTFDNLCASDIDLVGASRFENRVCWTDSCGGFWTFGGSTGSVLNVNYSDLWYFNSQTLEWTRVNGSPFSNPGWSYGTQGVSDPSNQPPSRGGAVSWIGLDGSLWFWGGTNFFATFYNDLWRYVIDPSCPATNLCGVQASINFSVTDPIICEKFCVDFFDQSINNPTTWQWFFPGGDPAFSADENPLNICYNIPGTYDVTLITSNANGNDTLTLTNYITVYPTPPLPTITQNGNTLTCSAAANYQWQFNSVDIPGATNQSYAIQQSGYYSVFITDENGCVASANLYVLVEGIEEVNSDANVLVYPNPSDGNFIIELLQEDDDDEISVSVINTIGQIIFSSSVLRSIPISQPWKKEINLNDVSDGIYFIEIKLKNIFFRKKILISN